MVTTWFCRIGRAACAVLTSATVFLAVAGAAAQEELTAPSDELVAAVEEVVDTPAAPPSVSEPAGPPKVDASAGVQESRPGAFEIHVQGLDLRAVLQMLSTQGRKNIVATREVTGQVTADLYGVTFKEALEAILRSSGFVYEEKQGFIYVMTPKQKQELSNTERVMDTKPFRLAYITAADARALITPLLSKDGTIAITPSASTGIGSSKTDAGGNTYATEDLLIVRDYEDSLRRIEQVIRDIDIKPDQILIEATILSVTLDETNALGIDFNTLAGVDFNALNSTTPGLTDLTTGTVNTSDINKAAATVRTDFNSAVPAGGMTVGFIGNEVSFFVRALESVTDTTILANPKLLVVNKQRGEFMVGKRDGYLTTTVAETVATQTVQFLETGTRLIVRPFIGKDGYVRMEIHPENSTGSTSEKGSFVLPSEETTEVTSNVMVRDGHTIVIGGLFRETTTAGRSQVPLIGNIPYLGTFFRRTTDKTVREEVVILLTPRIVKQDVDEAVAAQIKDDVNRLHVGARKGLRWWGRQRLAQMHLRWARTALAEGDSCKSVWNVDMALNLSPQLVEAIQLKEQLTGEAYWSKEARTSAVRFAIEQMIMQELGYPVELIVPPCKPLEVSDIPQDVRQSMNLQERCLPPLLCPPAEPVGELRIEDGEVKFVPPAPAEGQPATE